MRTQREGDGMDALDRELDALLEEERVVKARAFGLPFIPEGAPDER